MHHSRARASATRRTATPSVAATIIGARPGHGRPRRGGPRARAQAFATEDLRGSGAGRRPGRRGPAGSDPPVAVNLFHIPAPDSRLHLPRPLVRSDSDERRSGAVPPEISREAEKLRAELNRHSYLYYVEARPVISDAEFDELFDRLVVLERQHPGLVTPDSAFGRALACSTTRSPKTIHSDRT